jgi:DNA end-binding protein Ku
MVWPDEVRKAQFDVLDREVSVSDAELRMADTLIEAMASDFAPETYHDRYREALLSVIEAKTAGTSVAAASEPAEPTPPMDLITALQASVEAAKAARGEQVNVPKQRKSDASDKRTQRRR